MSRIRSLPALESDQIYKSDEERIQIISSFLRNTSNRLLQLEIYLETKEKYAALRTIEAIRKSSSMVGASALAETSRQFLEDIKLHSTYKKKFLRQLYDEYSRLTCLLRLHGIVPEDG